MGEVSAYPFARWAKLSRAEARLAGRLARALDTMDGAALADARTVLGAAVSVRGMGTRVDGAELIAGEVGESVAMIAAIGAHRAVLALAPGIARVIADRVVGGTGSDVALGPTPVSRGEAGLVAYVVARALARARGPFTSLLDVGKAREVIGAWGEARAIAAAFELSIGEQRGAGCLVVPLSALEDLASSSRAIDPTLRVCASILIGDARIPAREVKSLLPGDVLVPDTLTLDPRVADVGRARMVVGRSSRAFELELSGGTLRVVRAMGLAAPRAPVRWKQRKDPAMSQPDTDTLQSLADVEVELSIELARLEMPIAEVAALAPGVVVTTGRLVGERVAIRAGDRVIAWGELVDVEGEVGVRLTEVAARAD